MLFAVQMTATLGYTPQITLFFLFPFLLAFSTYYKKTVHPTDICPTWKDKKIFPVGDKMEQILVLILLKKADSYKFILNLQN